MKQHCIFFQGLTSQDYFISWLNSKKVSLLILKVVPLPCRFAGRRRNLELWSFLQCRNVDMKFMENNKTSLLYRTHTQIATRRQTLIWKENYANKKQQNFWEYRLKVPAFNGSLILQHRLASFQQSITFECQYWTGSQLSEACPVIDFQVKAVIDPPRCRPRLPLTETLVGSFQTGGQSRKFEWAGPIYSDGHVQD